MYVSICARHIYLVSQIPKNKTPSRLAYTSMHGKACQRILYITHVCIHTSRTSHLQPSRLAYISMHGKAGQCILYITHARTHTARTSHLQVIEKSHGSQECIHTNMHVYTHVIHACTYAYIHTSVTPQSHRKVAWLGNAHSAHAHMHTYTRHISNWLSRNGHHSYGPTVHTRMYAYMHTSHLEIIKKSHGSLEMSITQTVPRRQLLDKLRVPEIAVDYRAHHVPHSLLPMCTHTCILVSTRAGIHICMCVYICVYI